jgi:hypothetical protein
MYLSLHWKINRLLCYGCQWGHFLGSSSNTRYQVMHAYTQTYTFGHTAPRYVYMHAYMHTHIFQDTCQVMLVDLIHDVCFPEMRI